MISTEAIRLSTLILDESHRDAPDPELLFCIMLKINASEMQSILAVTDKKGKTAIYNLIANLLMFSLQNSPLEHVDNISLRLKAIAVITAYIDTSNYIKLFDNFTILKDNMQYAQSSKLEQSREQVLMCLKSVLQTNMRVNALVTKVQTLSRSERIKIVAPIVLIQNEFETAAIKFFYHDCVNFAKTENVKEIFVEIFNTSPSNEIKQQKHSAMTATGLRIFPINFIPTYSDKALPVWHDAVANFDMINILLNSRARGFANAAALASLKHKGRVIIYCQPFEVYRIFKEFYKINKTSSRTIVLSDPESIAMKTNNLLSKYLEKYKSCVDDLCGKLLIETLNYSHKDPWFDLILTKGRYELNFIWVGPNTMPISQRENLLRIKASNPSSIVQVWTIGKIINNEMKKYFTENQINLVEIKILLDPVKYPKIFEMVTALQTTKTLWSALADILKFLILARNLEFNAPARRYYMESDNEYPENLNLQTKQKDFMHQYMENAFGFEECTNVDSYYINLDTFIGKCIQCNASQYLERLLADPIVNNALKTIIETDLRLGFLIENVVIETFGAIPSTLCRGLFESLNLNFKQFAEPKFAYQSYEGRSWVSPKASKSIASDSLEYEDLKNSVQATKILFGYFKHIATTPTYWNYDKTDQKNPKKLKN